MTTKMKSNDDRFIELCKSKVQYELLQQYVISKDITSLNGYMPNFPHEFHVWFESEIRKFLRLYVSNLDFHPPAVALSRSQSAPSSSGDCNMLTATTHISNTSYFVPQSSSSQPSGALISDIPLTVQRKKKVISKLITVPDNNGNTLNNESNTDRLNSSYAQNTEQTAVSSTSPTSPAFDFQNGFETGVSVSIDRNEDRIIIGSFINNSNTNSNNNINQISKASSSIQPAQNSKTSTSGCLDTTRYASEIYCDLVLAQLIRVEQAVALLVLLATTSYDDEKINKNSIFTTINTNTNIHINSSSPLTARLLSSKTDLLCLTSTLFEKLYPIICRLGHTFARGFGTSKVFISVNSRLCEDLLSIADDAECHSQFATMAISSPDIFVRPPRFDADSQLAHEREKYFDEFSNVFHSFQNILQQQQQQQQQVGNNIESILSRYWQSTGFLLLRKVTNLQSANMPWFVDLFVKMLLFYCSKDDAGLLNVEYSVSNSHDSLNEADKLQIQPFSSQQEQPQQMYPSLSSTPTTTSFQSLYNSSPVVTPVHSSHLISTMAGESQYQHSQVSHYNNTSYSMLSSSNGSSSSNGYSSMPGSHTGRLPPARPGHISMAVDAEKARKLEQRMSSMSSGIPMQQPTPFKGSDANNSATLNSRGIAAMETKSSVSRQSKKVHVSTTVTASNSSTNLSQYQEYTSSSSSFNSTSNNLIQTSTARDNGTNTLSQLFPRYQRFFIQYILLVDNAIFRQLLIESITTEVLELSKATSSSSSDNYRSSSSGSTAQLTIPFATQVVQLKILGKFLGFLESRGNTNMNMNMNSSHTTISISSRRSTSNSGKVNTSSPVKSNTDTNNYGNDQRLPVNRHNALMKIFPTQKLLQQAWVNGNLCLTIPWIIEFLSFILYNSQSVSDSNSSTPDGRNILSGSIGAYQDTIITLHEIQRSSNVCLRNSILTNNILFVLWEIQSFERLLNSFSYDTTSLSGQQHSSLSSLPSVSPRSEDRHICIDDGDEAFSYKFISSVLPSLKILADSLTLKHSDLLTSRPLVNMSSPMAAPLPGISASNSLQLYSEESIKRNNSAGNNAKFSLFATPTKDRRLNIKSPIQKNPSEFTISSQPSTRRTNTGAFSPRPVNLFNQSKAKKLKAIQSSLQGCFWQQHPQLQQMSVVLLDHIQQACSIRLKDKIASSVRELWTFVAHLNRQSRSRLYVQSLLLRSRETIESILIQSRKAHGVAGTEDGMKYPDEAVVVSSDMNELVSSFESILQNPRQSFAAKRVRYDQYDSELQEQADLIEKELIRESRLFLSDFIDTYLKHTLAELCALSPAHPMVVDLTIHLIKQQATLQHQSLVDFIANYGRRKLQEVFSLSCKQYAKSLRIYPDDNDNDTGGKNISANPMNQSMDGDENITAVAVSIDTDAVLDETSMAPSAHSNTTSMSGGLSLLVDDTSIQAMQSKVAEALTELGISIASLTKYIQSDLIAVDTLPVAWISTIISCDSVKLSAVSQNEWAIVFGYVTNVLRKSMKALSSLCRLIQFSEYNHEAISTRLFLHINIKNLLVLVMKDYHIHSTNAQVEMDNNSNSNSSSGRVHVSADYVMITQFVTTSIPICMLMDHTYCLSSTITQSTATTSIDSIQRSEMGMITVDLLTYLYQSNIIPITTLVKILISTGRKSTFLYYGACFQIPEFSSGGAKIMFQAIELFLQSIQILSITNTGGVLDEYISGDNDNDTCSSRKEENGVSELPWFRDETILARIDDVFSSDLKNLIISLHS